jgi:hypothetical protein
MIMEKSALAKMVAIISDEIVIINEKGINTLKSLIRTIKSGFQPEGLNR